jgi:glycosyltransferase involved in cell wall biosynthesis
MKLLYLSNTRLPTEKAHGAQIMKTCEAFARAGVDLTLVVTDRRSDIADDPFSYYGVTTRFPIVRLPVLDFVSWGKIGFMVEVFSFAFAAARFARKRKPDRIFGRDEIVLWVASLFGQRDIVWESHTGSWNFFVRRMVPHLRALVVITEGLREFYIGHGVPADKIVVAPDGVDLEAFAHPESKDEARLRLQLPQYKRIAMYIGRLDSWRGASTLCEAAAYFPPDVCAVLIGGESAQVADFKRRYPNVIFSGFRPYRELADNQAAADVLVLPGTGGEDISAHFTSPLKLFTYMASGRPIVASDLPSLREILSSENAILVEVDNPEALARGVMQALQDTEGSTRRSLRAREDVERYTWERRGRTIIDLIERAA